MSHSDSISPRSMSSIGYSEDEPMFRRPVACFTGDDLGSTSSSSSGKRSPKRKEFAARRKMSIATDHTVLQAMKAQVEKFEQEIQILMISEKAIRDHLAAQALIYPGAWPNKGRRGSIHQSVLRANSATAAKYELPSPTLKKNGRKGKNKDLEGQCCVIC
eukprot:TRINITY_DN3910_c5_g1_i1.p1 TRINITY_DN3910_c5_g1~~TRINITY_DN3910_c5_g1_i1.p1  ORF type:complete len:175 (+),score=42.47 TRINITY_DN3910_c5_g1_i1:48-527(+)